MPESSKRPVKELSKVLKVSGNAVCQTSLEVCPNKFIGVKLRRISRKVKGLDARIASKEFLGELGLVERAAVPEKDKRSLEVTREMPKELSDLFAPKVFVGMEARVESKSFPLRRDGDGRDGRDFGPASGDNERWRSPSNRPGSLEVRNERESALIQEYQAGSKLIGFFLYEAKRDVSSNGWLVPGVLWLSFAVSGNSNPSPPSDSKDLRCNNSLGISCVRSGRSASRSKDPSSNRLPKGLSPRCAPGFSSAFLTKAAAVPYWAEPLNRTALSSGRLDTNAPPSLAKRSVSGRPSDKSGLASEAGRLDAVFFRLFGVCHEVS